MHPVLRIDEILIHILTELTQKSDCRSMALTCKAFQTPALAELWRSLEDLQPLLNLLGEGNPVATGLSQRSTSAKAEWSRWSTYSRHVHEIQSVEVGSITSGLLENASPLEDLLPSLRKATITSYPSHYPTLSRLISGKNLRRLSYGHLAPFVPEERAIILADLCSFLVNGMAPSLCALDVRRLQISIHNAWTRVPAIELAKFHRSIAHAIATQSSLRSLMVASIHGLPSILQGVARLAHLSILHVELWAFRFLAESPEHLPPLELSPGSFPSLVYLSVETHSSIIDQLDTILPHCSALRKLRLVYHWRSPAPLFPESLAGLTRLEDLNVTVTDHEQEGSFRAYWLAQGSQDLQILTSLRQLRYVFLLLPRLAGSGTKLIRSLAQAWPKLQVLYLEASTRQHHFRAYPLQDLILFAQHCPNLSHLHIPFTSHPPMSVGDAPAILSEQGIDAIAPGMKRVVLAHSHLDQATLQKKAAGVLQFWPNVVVEVPSLFSAS